MIITLKNGEKIRLNTPIDWGIYDKKYGSQTAHHINSLRWIDFKNINLMNEIISDFYNYHIIKKNKNRYYNTEISADHCITIRLNNFLTILNDNINPKINDKLIKLIESDIDNLYLPYMYRLGHNHGLMIDICLLNINRTQFSYKIPDIKYVINRGKKTLDCMIYKNGLTKEHSISYQLFNLANIIKFIKLSKVTDYNIDELLKFSKQFIHHFNFSENYIFEFGDSGYPYNKECSTIDSNLYKQLYNNEFMEEKKNIILNDIYNANNAFSSIYYKNKNNNIVHFALTCNHHSKNHKHNDELSFCLAVNKELIFDDISPTKRMNLPNDEKIYLSSENVHSTVLIDGHNWNKKNVVNNKSKILNIYKENDKYYLDAAHSRINDITIKRNIILDNNLILIKDTIDNDKNVINENTIVTRRFILNRHINFKFSENKCELFKNDKFLVSINCKNCDFKNINEEMFIKLTLNGFDIISTYKNMKNIYIYI